MPALCTFSHASVSISLWLMHESTDEAISMCKMQGINTAAIEKLSQKIAKERACTLLALRELETESNNSLEISHNADGAPILNDNSLGISISHSRDIAAVAILPLSAEATGNDGFGIDIEQINERVGLLSPRFLSDAELGCIAESDNIAFTKAWTAKEAVFKAHGKEAVDFAKSIRLSPDFNTASVNASIYELKFWHLEEQNEILCLAIKREK